MQPFGLNLARAGVTALLLWILFFFNPSKNRIKRKDILRFVLCALTGIALNQLLFLKGLSLTNTTHASLLMLATPILVLLLAAWVLKEKITLLKTMGLLAGTGGATLLILNMQGNAAGGEATYWGDILIVLNALSYAVYFILVKPLMGHYNNVMIIRTIFTIGTFMILPFGWNELVETPWSFYTFTDYLILAAVIFCGTFLAYLFNIYGIKSLGASRAGGYIYIQPFIATLVAVVVLKEKIMFVEIIAGLMILIGVMLINFKKKT